MDILGVSLILPDALSVAVIRSLCVSFDNSLSYAYARESENVALRLTDQGTLGLA